MCDMKMKSEQWTCHVFKAEGIIMNYCVVISWYSCKKTKLIQSFELKPIRPTWAFLVSKTIRIIGQKKTNKM